MHVSLAAESDSSCDSKQPQVAAAFIHLLQIRIRAPLRQVLGRGGSDEDKQGLKGHQEIRLILLGTVCIANVVNNNPNQRFTRCRRTQAQLESSCCIRDGRDSAALIPSDLQPFGGHEHTFEHQIESSLLVSPRDAYCAPLDILLLHRHCSLPPLQSELQPRPLCLGTQAIEATRTHPTPILQYLSCDYVPPSEKGYPCTPDTSVDVQKDGCFPVLHSFTLARPHPDCPAPSDFYRHSRPSSYPIALSSSTPSKPLL